MRTWDLAYCNTVFIAGEIYPSSAEGKTWSWSSEGQTSFQAHVLWIGPFTQWGRCYISWCPEVSTMYCD